MPFFQRDLVHPDDLHGFDLAPIHRCPDMPVEYAFDGTLSNVMFDADILKGAVDKGQQDILLKGFGERTFRRIPLQFLGRGWLVIALLALVSLWPHDNICFISKNG